MDSKTKKILIVDDEEDLCEILQYNLGNEGYYTEIAHSAEEALKKRIHEFDLYLLDVMMGTMSGFELADKIRKELKLNSPIIFLTAKDNENDVLTGFHLGADDYIAKPFSINQLLVRVNAVLNRSGSDRNKRKSIIRFGEMEIDTVKKKLSIQDKKINLTKKEYEIIKLFLEKQGEVLTRDELLESIWGNDVVVNERTVDVHIARLRNKLGPYSKNLQNKIGFGYFFDL
jgi:two-component system alkaline phosphatase synthesis response regulator PhoP